MPEPHPVPAGFGVRPAPSTRWLTPTVLAGGSPALVVELSTEAADAARRVLAGEAVDDTTANIARRLLDADMAEPVLCVSGPSLADVAVVIPAHNAARTLGALLDSLPAGLAEVVVVDDRCTDGTPVIARRRGARVIRSGRPGPAAARNAGLRGVAAPVVLLVDADTVVQEHAIELLVGAFADPAVAVAGPRVRSVEAGAGLAERYEAARPPWDLGQRPGRVRRGGRVGFLPGAALLVRRDVVLDIGGFDEDLVAGEDTDLVWRIDGAGWTVRYEPAAVVWHAHHTELGDLFRRRRAYGLPYAELARRHPGGLAALTLPRVPVLALWRAQVPAAAIARLIARAGLVTARAALFALTRTWLPVALVAAVLSGRARRVLVGALLVRHLADWPAPRPRVGPGAWVGLRTADDLMFAAGVWQGAYAMRDPAPLLVRRRRRPRAGTPAWTVVAQLG